MLSNYSSSDRYGYNYKHLGSGAERRTCQCARRRVFIVAAGLISTCTIVWAVASGGLPFWRRLKEPPPGTVLPPLYAEYHEAELRLPQQNWDITEPMEGEKFFYVAGHIRGLGWGNALEEHLLSAYLAYRAGRTFVFDNYTWNDDGSQYTQYGSNWIPSQIPYTAIIRGPSVGDPFPPKSPAVPAVSKTYFDHVCPHKVEKNREKVHKALSNPNSAEEMIALWNDVLKREKNPCVQTPYKNDPIFNHYHIWGVRGSLRDVWPGFSTSPIMTQFRWSPLIERAFDVNRLHFLPLSSTEPLLSATAFTTSAQRYKMIPGLMVIHVRRGDYEEHCRYLAGDRQDFVSVNTFPQLPDQFDVPPSPPRRKMKATPEQVEHYRQRCFPSVDEMARKVREVRATPAGKGIGRVYIMTNGKSDFLTELKAALWDIGEWEGIFTSRDLVMDWEQKSVAQAVDQLVAQRAQVLIGNGFSTLTSDAVMMRLANGFDTQSNRFW